MFLAFEYIKIHGDLTNHLQIDV